MCVLGEGGVPEAWFSRDPTFIPEGGTFFLFLLVFHPGFFLPMMCDSARWRIASIVMLRSLLLTCG